MLELAYPASRPVKCSYTYLDSELTIRTLMLYSIILRLDWSNVMRS